MIHYLVTPEHRYTMDGHLRTWGRSLRGRVRVVPYTRLLFRRRFAPGTYIFSDLERLTEAELATSRALADGLVAAGARVLNHPARALRRYAVLRTLHDAGINRFNAHRLARRAEARLPVFLRREDEHNGSLTELLRTPEALEQAVAELPPSLDRERILAVEYCHTADATGTFRKYSALKIGPRTIPRHLLFSRDWVDKVPDIVTEAYVAEEAAFMASDPHAAAVARVFELTQIEYGRVDYGVLDGAIQVWEINTNPMITALPENIAPLRLPGQQRVAERINAAYEAIDSEPAGAPVRIAVPAAARRGLGRSVARRMTSLARRWWVRRRNGRIWRFLTGWMRPAPASSEHA
jgi:hypothetical protein